MGRDTCTSPSQYNAGLFQAHRPGGGFAIGQVANLSLLEPQGYSLGGSMFYAVGRHRFATGRFGRTGVRPFAECNRGRSLQEWRRWLIPLPAEPGAGPVCD